MEFNQVWRCRECGIIICDSCSKGGNLIRKKHIRIGVGILTLGISEVVLAVYRKMKQHCTNCGSQNLIKI
jgi:DNA-directed RNA polymerase subunit RPC12/RpoP